MAQPIDVRVVQVCSVAPPQGTITSSTPASLTFTFFDLMWLRSQPISCLFFYEFPNPHTSFFDSVLPNLKHSLSLTLQHFLPLAGNITWPHNSHKPIIKYLPGDAVSFTTAESNADFNHHCSNLCEASKRHRLIPHLSTSHEQASVMALQVTLFPNSGFCIGITTHHAVMDGNSFTLFMKSWTYACSKFLQSPPSFSLSEQLTPLYDRSTIRDPTGIGAIYLNQLMKQGGGPNNRSLKVLESVKPIPNEAIRGSFELTPWHIQKLKQNAQFELKMKVQHLSTFSITCAYVIACLVKAEQTRADRVVLVFAVDCRSRWDPPIVPKYFGNCIRAQIAVIEANKLLGDDGFASALEGINEALSKIDDGFLCRPETMASKMQPFKNEKVRIFSIAGSPRFEVYDADFGWGRPRKVDITSIDKTGAFSLSGSRNNNGGIEIGLVLSKSEMEAFTTLFVEGLESF